MNHTDTVPAGEGWQYNNAVDSAEAAIYEKLRDLFGVHGENLSYYLERVTPPTPFETAELMRELRAEYRKRVAVEANRRMEESHD